LYSVSTEYFGQPLVRNEEIYDLHSAQNISWKIIERQITQAGYKAGEEKLIQGFGGKI
jgi:hypothetical protein